jgi:hypothetical protein
MTQSGLIAAGFQIKRTLFPIVLNRLMPRTRLAFRIRVKIQVNWPVCKCKWVGSALGSFLGLMITGDRLT